MFVTLHRTLFHHIITCITLSFSMLHYLFSVFQRLANDKFCDKNHCIVITVRTHFLVLGIQLELLLLTVFNC